MPRPSPTSGRSVFDLPDALVAKTAPALIARDEQQLAAITDSIEHHVAVLDERLGALRRLAVRDGQAVLERDQEIHRLTADLRALRRYGADLCLGRMVFAGNPDPVYLGRAGLLDADGTALLVDWRAPAAKPFFAATHADPMGLISRRRFRWTLGRISDYWDEAFTEDALANGAALDDQSAFIASLGGDRSPRMRDVLSTIQADQDAIIRAGSRGTLVVDGGPGTGKTVVALHRAAYLLYADPLVGHERGGVLFVGPHEPYLAYVADVLPSLGEEGVRTCTLRRLVPEGAQAVPEPDPLVARLKGQRALVDAIDAAVAFYEQPPTEALEVGTAWDDVRLTAADWAEAFETPDPGTPHNLARDEIWEALVRILHDKHAPQPQLTLAAVRRDAAGNAELVAAFRRAWPLLRATDVVADLWSVPAYLRLCAPHLSRAEVRALQRSDPYAWTDADLPLLDAAHRRLGDPEQSRQRRGRERILTDQRDYMTQVVDDLIAADDDGEGLVTQLKVADMRERLVDENAVPERSSDPLAGPFAHVVVDEAQELTDAQWQMLISRCPSGSLTVVGDRAQARLGFAESWTARLYRVGLRDITVASLRINYRTPTEVMAVAEPEIRRALPNANVPVSVRSAGLPVRYGSASDLPAVLAEWAARRPLATACVVGAATVQRLPRVRVLSAAEVKGLEFDLVVLVDPEELGAGIAGAVDRYVAMTRTTQQLVVLHTPPRSPRAPSKPEVGPLTE